MLPLTIRLMAINHHEPSNWFSNLPEVKALGFLQYDGRKRIARACWSPWRFLARARIRCDNLRKSAGKVKEGALTWTFQKQLKHLKYQSTSDSIGSPESIPLCNALQCHLCQRCAMGQHGACLLVESMEGSRSTESGVAPTCGTRS